MSSKTYTDLWGIPNWDQPIDLSWPLRFDGPNPSAFHIPAPSREPLRMGGFVGSVAAGGGCNVYALTLHPHGQGTHSECVGHIATEPYHINDCLQKFWFRALFCRVEPRSQNGDRVIARVDLERIWDANVLQFYKDNGYGEIDGGVDAIVVCTDDWGYGKFGSSCPDFSGSNPPYFEATAMEFFREKGVLHLLTDLPSVDREEDGGLLSAHHAFWNYPHSPRLEATITEMIHVPSDLEEGLYHLNLMIAPLQSDASPSKPILYPRLRLPL